MLECMFDDDDDDDIYHVNAFCQGYSQEEKIRNILRMFSQTFAKMHFDSDL